MFKLQGYLRERGYHEALSSFMLETDIAEGKMVRDLKSLLVSVYHSHSFIVHNGNRGKKCSMYSD